MKKIFVALLAVPTVGAQAGGFEKGVSWGADMNGRGGAGLSVVSGPEALYFNPAGLANGREGFAASAQFSPSWVSVKGPVLTTDQSIDAKGTVIPFAGLLGSYGLNEKTSIGLGVYAAGGLRANYEGIDLTGINSNFAGFTPTTKSELTLIEASLGGAYRVMPGLKIGAGWRASFITGNFQSTVVQTSSLGAAGSYQVATTAGLQNLSASNFAGFRVGAQYEPEGSPWGVGFNIRTPITINMKGTTFGSGKGAFVGVTGTTGLEATNAANSIVDFTGGEGTASSKFPTLIGLGSHLDILDKKVRLHLTYSWANYKAVDKIDVGGSVTTGKIASDTQVGEMNTVVPNIGTGVGLGTAVAAGSNEKATDLPDFDTGWKDEHTVRLGVECMAVDKWTLRTGYSVSNSVVPADKGRATFGAPGVGHSLTAGAGTSFLGGTLLTDLAVDYSWQSGTITASAANGNIGGQQKTSAFGLHTGVTYLF